MRKTLLVFVILFYVTAGLAQSNLSFYETVEYINKILEKNGDDLADQHTFSRPYHVEADRSGNIKFSCRCGQIWFNLTDAIEVGGGIFSQDFIFPMTYKVKCNESCSCGMGYLQNEKHQNIKAFWGGVEFAGLDLDDVSRLVKAFKHLKTLIKDPFGK